MTAGALCAALAAWSVVVAEANRLPSNVDTQVPQAARAIAASLFLLAGVLCLARWRITDEQRAARTGAALILLGAALPLISLLGPLMQTRPELMRAVPAGRLLLVFPVLTLMACRSRFTRRRVDHPLLLAAVLFAGWVAAAMTLAEWSAAAALLPMDTPPVWLTAECVAAALWLALATSSWQENQRETRASRNWIAVGLGLMGLYELLKAQTIIEPPSTFGFGPGVQVLAATVLAVAAATELREAHRVDGGRSRLLAHALADAHQQLAKVQQLHRERVHDARSAVIGVLGASQLLSQSAASAPDPDRLRRLIAAELDRLQVTLDTESAERIEEFSLTDVLGPVVLAHRLAGGTVDTAFGAVYVIGRPRTTATAIANLLANARAHAPGAGVTIGAQRCGSTVVLTVDDDGAGIPAAERKRVLLRGVRGAEPGAPGSGLGLYTAGAAMAAQSGTLQLTERPGGGTRAVLTLPAAHRLPWIDPRPTQLQAS
jgi:signal transduction histidine kinase